VKITLVFVGSDTLDERIPAEVEEKFTRTDGHLTVTAFNANHEDSTNRTLVVEGQTLPEWASAAMARSCQITIEGVPTSKFRLGWDDDEQADEAVPTDLTFVATSTNSQGTPAGELLQQLLAAHQATINELTA
jgi:hypothetical protein